MNRISCVAFYFSDHDHIAPYILTYVYFILLIQSYDVNWRVIYPLAMLDLAFNGIPRQPDDINHQWFRTDKEKNEKRT